jgi:peptidoglycan/LPS O-acetylase OafA/YrhL
MSLPRKKRLEFLDSLRGIAAVYVVIFHTALVSAPKPSLPDWAKPIVLFGASGVMLFFVISGFSLCLTMPRHEQSNTPLASYYLSRFFRIAPLLG